METLIIAFGPVFAAGLAVQQLIEIADGILELLFKLVVPSGLPIEKKPFLSLISLLAGLFIAAGAGLRVLEPLGIQGAGLADVFVTGLLISAGTESFNSIIKFLGYVKDDRKFTTQTKIEAAEAQQQ